MKKINLPAVVIITIVIMLIVVFAASLLGGWGYRGWRMMGPWMHGGWGYSSFGWIGMISMWLIPAGLLVLSVSGAIWLVRALAGPRVWDINTLEAGSCPSCGKSVQTGWRNCPYCGEVISNE